MGRGQNNSNKVSTAVPSALKRRCRQGNHSLGRWVNGKWWNAASLVPDDTLKLTYQCKHCGEKFIWHNPPGQSAYIEPYQGSVTQLLRTHIDASDKQPLTEEQLLSLTAP